MKLKRAIMVTYPEISHEFNLFRKTCFDFHRKISRKPKIKGKMTIIILKKKTYFRCIDSKRLGYILFLSDSH